MDLKPFIAAVSKEGLDLHGVLVRQHDAVLDSFYWWERALFLDNLRRNTQ